MPLLNFKKEFSHLWVFNKMVDKDIIDPMKETACEKLFRRTSIFPEHWGFILGERRMKYKPNCRPRIYEQLYACRYKKND